MIRTQKRLIPIACKGRNIGYNSESTKNYCTPGACTLNDMKNHRHPYKSYIKLELFFILPFFTNTDIHSIPTTEQWWTQDL